MNELKVPTWFWVVSGLALLWNAMGVMAFIQFMLMTPESMAEMSEAQQNLHKDTPIWANIAFAFAVIGGLLGCLFILLKKKFALYILIISFIAILIQMYNAFFIMDSFAVFGPGGTIMPIMVIVIAALLIWFAKFSTSKTWLK